MIANISIYNTVIGPPLDEGTINSIFSYILLVDDITFYLNPPSLSLEVHMYIHITIVVTLAHS